MLKIIIDPLVINIGVMMGMGACGAMGTHSCGTGDCVMGSPFTLTCVFPAFSLPKWLWKTDKTKQAHTQKRGVNDVESKNKLQSKKICRLAPHSCTEMSFSTNDR